MPIGRTQPKTSLFQQTGIVYGPPKVGKTTLLSRFPRAVFLATERGHDHVNVDRWEKTPGDYVITSWEDLLLATAEVLKTDAETVIIDTIGNACQLADAYICKQSGEVYKNDGKLGFNKGTTLILNEVKRYLTKLAGTGRGVWLVAHAATKTETKRTGNIEKTQPFFPGDNKAGDLYNGIIGTLPRFLSGADIGYARDIATAIGNHAAHGLHRTGPHPHAWPLPGVFPVAHGALLGFVHGQQNERLTGHVGQAHRRALAQRMVAGQP
jgi:hypothetical protein